MFRQYMFRQYMFRPHTCSQTHKTHTHRLACSHIYPNNTHWFANTHTMYVYTHNNGQLELWQPDSVLLGHHTLALKPWPLGTEGTTRPLSPRTCSSPSHQPPGFFLRMRISCPGASVSCSGPVAAYEAMTWAISGDKKNQQGIVWGCHELLALSSWTVLVSPGLSTPPFTGPKKARGQQPQDRSDPLTPSRGPVHLHPCSSTSGYQEPGPCNPSCDG